MATQSYHISCSVITDTFSLLLVKKGFIKLESVCVRERNRERKIGHAILNICELNVMSNMRRLNGIS